MNEEAINAQVGLLIQIVRCIQMKKVLFEVDPDPELNFWRIIHGGLLDISALDWCKIFGSNAEPTHWKGVVPDTEIEIFRAELLSYLGMTQDEWNNYWHQIKDYRDELIAHYELNSDVSTYPILDIALRACYFYFDYLVKLRNDVNAGSFATMEEYSSHFYIKAKEIATKAIEATRGIDVTVN